MQSARSRAASEPEHNVPISVGQRPYSSYEWRKDEERKDFANPDMVKGLAQKLGIPLDRGDLNIKWVIKDCLLRLEELGWTCQIAPNAEGGDLTFCRHVTGEKRSVHEIVDLHAELAKQILFQHDSILRKREDTGYMIQEMIFNRLVDTRESSMVVTPGLIENVLDLLKIDLHSENHLIGTLIDDIISAHRRMLSLGGPSRISVETCFDLNHLVTRLGLKRAAYLKFISPSHLMFCIECESLLADGICGSCGDCYCASCFYKLHKKGNRENHLLVFLEQCVCSECELACADFYCNECSDLFCRNCFDRQHKSERRSQHGLRMSTTVFCMHCTYNEAHLMCQECLVLVCISCASSLHHSQPANAESTHTLSGLKSLVFPSKAFVGNFDHITAIVDKYLSHNTYQHWYRLSDADGQPFWYNFYTKEMTRSETPPPVEVHVAREMEMVSRKRASSRASFVVPKKSNVQFVHTSTT